MHRLILSLTLLACIAHPSWSADDVSHTNPLTAKFSRTYKQVDDRISDLIAENVLHFGHNLGLELAALDPYVNRSEIFSPLSIMASLSLLTLGAKGRSYQELKQLVGLDSDSELIQHPSKFYEELGLMLYDLQHSNVNSGGVNKRPNVHWRTSTRGRMQTRPRYRIDNQPSEHIIKVANGIFVRNGYTLNPDYSQVLQSLYDTELQELDFQYKNRESRDYINAWVDKATFGRIPKVINGDIDQSTNLILASALYFKAYWQTPFFDIPDNEQNFYPDGLENPAIKVQMMYSGGVFPFYDAKEYDCRIFGLPYRGNESTMYIIQPNNSSRQKLREFQHVLTAHKINAMIDNMERRTALLVFPKMHFTRSMTMKGILETMNVRDIFHNGDSDLSLIAGRQTQTSYAAPPLSAPPRSAVSFESINRKMPVYPRPQFFDKNGEPALVSTSRFGEIKELSNNTNDKSMETTTVTPALHKITKRALNNDPYAEALMNLEANRQKVDSYRSNIFVDDILHTVDLIVNERGTEAAGATISTLLRSGSDVIFRAETPFLMIIRHDPTKLPLFYGIINEPKL